MPNLPCQICFHPGRKPRFQTRDVTICQRCITELKGTLESPAETIEVIQAKFREKHTNAVEFDLECLEGKRPLPPKGASTSPERIAAQADADVRRSESLGRSLFRSLVDDSARRYEVAAREQKLRASAFLEHERLLAQHKAELYAFELRIQAIKSRLNEVNVLVERDFQKFLAVRLAPRQTKFSTTRLLRAHHLGIIQPTRTFAKRPGGAEAEEMGRYIRKRDGYVCTICQRVPRGSELHVHHIIPLSNFGTNSEVNLATLCYACHNRQHPEFTVQRMHKRSAGVQSEA